MHTPEDWTTYLDRDDSAAEQYYLHLIKHKRLRVVHSTKRKRKLLKRGENIRWCRILNVWLWLPQINPEIKT